ncbi:hypothetical protein D3C81_1783060 [compost metagenome]
MAPVAKCVHVAEIETLLKAKFDSGESASDLAGYEGLTANRGLMVEQDAVACVHAIRFAIVDGDPVGVKLCDRVGRARIEGGGFLLRNFLHQAVQFGCRETATWLCAARL